MLPMLASNQGIDANFAILYFRKAYPRQNPLNIHIASSLPSRKYFMPLVVKNVKKRRRRI